MWCFRGNVPIATLLSGLPLQPGLLWPSHTRPPSLVVQPDSSEPQPHSPSQRTDFLLAPSGQQSPLTLSSPKGATKTYNNGFYKEQADKPFKHKP